MSSRVSSVLLLALAMTLAACRSTPPAPPRVITGPRDDSFVAPPSLPTAGTYEQRLRDQAEMQLAQGRLAEAAVTWEILTVLRPASGDYRERLADSRRRIAEAVPEYLQRAEQAQKRGEQDAAVAQYLGALALQPDNAKAADALRAMERERNRRNYLGRSVGSMVLAQRPAVAPPTPVRSEGRTAALDRNDFEHAAMLASQGELDDAIGLLERRLVVDKRDTLACQLLADMYYRKAERQLPKDKAGARASLEKSLKLDASNPRAAARLKQLASDATPPSGGCASGR